MVASGRVAGPTAAFRIETSDRDFGEEFYEMDFVLILSLLQEEPPRCSPIDLLTFLITKTDVTLESLSEARLSQKNSGAIPILANRIHPVSRFCADPISVFVYELKRGFLGLSDIFLNPFASVARTQTQAAQAWWL